MSAFVKKGKRRHQAQHWLGPQARAGGQHAPLVIKALVKAALTREHPR